MLTAAGCGPAPAYVGTYKVVDTPAARSFAKTLDIMDAHAGNLKGPKNFDVMQDAVLTVSANGNFTIDHPSYDKIEGFVGSYTVDGDVLTVSAADPKKASTFIFDKKSLTLTQTAMGTKIVYKKR